MTSRRLFASDQGASALIVAISMFVLMGFAALVVDLGAGFNERAQDQSAADAAVLGGALEALLTTSDPAQAAVDEAKALADANLGRTIPQSDWDSCTDPGALDILSNSIPGVVGGSPCISFGDSNGRESMRVKVPDQLVSTSFGNVLGTSALATNAVAESAFAGPGGGSYPAGVFAGDGAGVEFCIKTGSNDKGSCGPPTYGGFGTFLPFIYYAIDGDTAPIGVSGEQTAPLARVIADGLDHELGLVPGPAGAGNGSRRNGSLCTNNPKLCGPLLPDQVEKSGGNQPADITMGLVLGGNYSGSYKGRLNRAGGYVDEIDNGNAPGSFTVFGKSLDNRPLWTFIDPGQTSDDLCLALADLPGSPPAFPYTIASTAYHPEYTVQDWDDAKEKMKTCLSNEGDSLLFSKDILSSLRLATVPRFWQLGECGNNACIWDVKEIVPIFIQGIWTDLQKNKWTCTGGSDRGSYCQYEPGMIGEISLSNGNEALGSASAIVLSCAQMPDPPCVTVAGNGNNTQQRNVAVELTK